RHYPDSAEHDAEVAEERPPTDVIRLERHYLFEIGDLISTLDLPWPRYAWLHVEPSVMVLLIKGHFRWQRGSRAHERHLSPKHVHKLGQLIHARPPQPAAQPGHPGIVGHLEQTRITVHHARAQHAP